MASWIDDRSAANGTVGGEKFVGREWGDEGNTRKSLLMRVRKTSSGGDGGGGGLGRGGGAGGEAAKSKMKSSGEEEEEEERKERTPPNMVRVQVKTIQH